MIIFSQFDGWSLADASKLFLLTPAVMKQGGGEELEEPIFKYLLWIYIVDIGSQ